MSPLENGPDRPGPQQRSLARAASGSGVLQDQMVTRITFHKAGRSRVPRIALAAALGLGLPAKGGVSAAAAGASVQDLVRVRCATDGRDTFFVFAGSVHALGLEPDRGTCSTWSA